jgi:hypothetical protein
MALDSAPEKIDKIQIYQNKWGRDEPVDVSLQILKLLEGLSER